MSIRTSLRGGFSFVETLMSVALVLMALTGAIAFYLNSSNTNQMSEKESEYYRLYTSLEMKLKRDLRSAVRLETVGPEEYKLTAVFPGGDGAPAWREIFYRVVSNGVIERKFEGKVEKFDFSKFESLYDKKGSPKFAFNIAR